MLTSEQQKIYNVKVPKGGYGYYTLYHGIYDPAKNIDERPSYAQTGDLFEPEGSSVVYKATRKNGKTTWAIDENAQRQSESGESGGGSGGGGGAEKFIVTLTQENDTWTADKTVAEIVAADEANQVVVSRYPLVEGMLIDIPLLFAGTFSDDGEEMAAAWFNTIIEGEHNTLTSITIKAQGADEDVWSVEATNTEIPNAPLVVTLTADQQNPGTYVGDKTAQECVEAYMAGRNVVFNLTISDSSVSCNAINATEVEDGGVTDYVLTVYIAADAVITDTTAGGYVSLTLGD